MRPRVPRPRRRGGFDKDRKQTEIRPAPS